MCVCICGGGRRKRMMKGEERQMRQTGKQNKRAEGRQEGQRTPVEFPGHCNTHTHTHTHARTHKRSFQEDCAPSREGFKTHNSATQYGVCVYTSPAPAYIELLLGAEVRRVCVSTVKT